MFKEDETQYCKNCYELTEQLDQLKAENEKLQEEREKAKNYNLEYGQLLIKATNKNNKLEQTLAEIKKLVEKEFCRHPECCKFCAISNDCVNQKILEKINDVEDEHTL